LIAGQHVRVGEDATGLDGAETVLLPLARFAQLPGSAQQQAAVHWIAVLEAEDAAAFGPQALADLARRLPAQRLRIVLASGAHGWLAEFDATDEAWRPLVGVHLAVEADGSLHRAPGAAGALRLRAPQA